jgi:O-acetyl-ADP-ribose deacetylase
VITFGYKLFAKRVIHAVAPVFHENRVVAPSLLASAYTESLKLASEEKLETLAFPCIGTGLYGFPKPEAAQIAIGICLEYEKEFPKEIIFCCFEEEDFILYEALLKRNFI